MKAAIFVLTLLLGGCAVTQPASRPFGAPLSGQWGGEQVGLEFDGAGHGHVTLSCASAITDGPIRPAADGTFKVAGQFTQGSGAPPVEAPTPVPATFEGRQTGADQLTLSIRIATGSRLEGTRLVRGRESDLALCP